MASIDGLEVHAERALGRELMNGQLKEGTT